MSETSLPKLAADSASVWLTKSATTHYQCGPMQHDPVQCQECHRDLALVWDIDLTDNNVALGIRTAFPDLTRLPFLVCWQCLVASYSVVSDSRIESHGIRGLDFTLDCESIFWKEASELDGQSNKGKLVIPDQPDRAFLDLVPNPDFVNSRLLDDPSDWTDEEFKKVSKFYGTDGNYRSWSNFNKSHIGGEVVGFQGQFRLICPNPSCEQFRPWDEMYDDTPNPMSGLALIHFKDHPFLNIDWDQLLYYCCETCGAISAQYTCT